MSKRVPDFVELVDALKEWSDTDWFRVHYGTACRETAERMNAMVAVMRSMAVELDRLIEDHS